MECTLKSRGIKGVLALKTMALSFEATSSKGDKLSLYVPFIQVEGVDMELRIMSNTFTIETIHGDLTFEEESEGGVKKFYVSAQKAIDLYNENNEEGDNGDKVVLDESELAFVKQRSTLIEKDLEPM